jgi:hypothetical protein
MKKESRIFICLSLGLIISLPLNAIGQKRGRPESSQQNNEKYLDQRAKRNPPVRLEVSSYQEGKDIVVYFTPLSKNDEAVPCAGDVRISLELRMNNLPCQRFLLTKEDISSSRFKLARVGYGIFQQVKVLAVFRIDANKKPPELLCTLSNYMSTMQNDGYDWFVVMEFVPTSAKRFIRNSALADSISTAWAEIRRQNKKVDSLANAVNVVKKIQLNVIDSLKKKTEEIKGNMWQETPGAARADSQMLWRIDVAIDSLERLLRTNTKLQHDSIRVDSIRNESELMRKNLPLSWVNVDGINGDTIFFKIDTIKLVNECKINW